MSLLAQQVAGLLRTYRPPVPYNVGRVHRIEDDDDMALPENRHEAPRACNCCHEVKGAEEFYMRADGRRYNDCRVCYNSKKKAAIQTKREGRA